MLVLVLVLLVLVLVLPSWSPPLLLQLFCIIVVVGVDGPGAGGQDIDVETALEHSRFGRDADPCDLDSYRGSPPVKGQCRIFSAARTSNLAQIDMLAVHFLTPPNCTKPTHR